MRLPPPRPASGDDSEAGVPPETEAPQAAGSLEGIDPHHFFEWGGAREIAASAYLATLVEQDERFRVAFLAEIAPDAPPESTVPWSVTVEDDRTGAGLVDIVAESTACVVLVENKVATGAMRDDQFAGYVKGAARAWPNRRIVAVYLAPRAAHGQPHVDDARVALHEAGLEDPRIVLVPLGWDRLGEIIDAEGGGANSFARRGLHAVRALLASRRVTIAWTHTDFEAAAETFGPDAGRIVGRTLLWLTERGLPLVLGSGATGPLYLAFPGRGGAPLHRAVRVFTAASFEVMLRDLAKAAPFDDPERRRDLIRRFNAIPGARVIDETYATEHDSFYLMPAFLARPGALEAVLDTLGWVADEIQSGPAG